MLNTTNQLTITEILPNGLELELIKVEGGSFLMGSNYRNREQPIHNVTASSFYLGCYPITNKQFVPFLNAKGNQEEGGRTWVNLGGSYGGVRCGIMETENGFACVKGLERHPMIYVNWYGAMAYCNWLSEQSGKAYRLPTEAEWEYAAKGGKKSKGFRYSGSNKLKEVGWYYNNSHEATKPVGLKLPNELDIYDMSGNVDEWCMDHWHGNYGGAPNDGSAWITKGSSNERVVRGGSWGNLDNNCRVSKRDWDLSNFRNDDVGFRVARF